jgi:hypothetical protein
MVDAAHVIELLEAGRFWPAFAIALLLATRLVRHRLVDAWLGRVGLPSHARALVPIALAGTAWLISMALPWDVSATEAAYTAVLSAMGAMAGHATLKAVGATTLALAAQPPIAAARGQENSMDPNETNETPKSSDPENPDRPPPPPPDEEPSPEAPESNPAKE